MAARSTQYLGFQLRRYLLKEEGDCNLMSSRLTNPVFPSSTRVHDQQER